MPDTPYVPARSLFYPEIFIDQVIQGVLALIEFVLGVRLILTLLGASPTAPFIAWFYHLTDAIVAPFRGAFPSFSVAGFTLDFSVIFAMIGYAIIGWLILRLVGFFAYLR